MLLFCHMFHRYVDAGQHVEHNYSPGSVTEVVAELGHMFLREHPAKFCDVSGEGDPASHTCAKSESANVPASFPVTALAQPPVDREMKPRYSPQKRLLIKKAQKRSRTARMQTREV